MLAKFKEAAYIYRTHFFLFAALVLTVWLPCNLFANYVYYASDGPEGEMRYFWYILLAEHLIGPLYGGALVFSLSRIKMGIPISYGEAMGVGLSMWLSVLIARVVAGVYVTLGFLGLILPGLWMMVRYSFIDFVVVLEGQEGAGARARSSLLTEGRRWSLFGAVALFVLLYSVVSFLTYLPLTYFSTLSNFWVESILDSATDVFFVFITVVFFLYYWEAVSEEPVDSPAVAEAGPPTGGQALDTSLEDPA